jgi:hypothetical protein
LNEARGYAHGELTGRSLLHALLLLLSDAATGHRPLAATLYRVLKTLYEESTLYSVFQLLRAQKNLWHRQFLPWKCWTNILKRYQRRDPMQRNHGDGEGAMIATTTNPSQHLLDEPNIQVGTLCPLESSALVSTFCNDPNGTFAHASDAIDPFSLSIELVMLPYFFPRNAGFFTRLREAQGSRFSFSRYVKFRCKQAFSIFTRHFHYLLLLRAMDLALQTIESAVRVRVFSDGYKRLNALHPHMSVTQLLYKILKEHIPRAIVHSPQFYKTGYKNLLTMAREYGLPHYFVTVTMDDASESATAEYRTVGDFVHNWCNETWKDAPIECSRMLLSRWKTIWNDFILSGSKILGDVEHYAIRYEVQGRQSLHVHIVLWLKSAAEVSQTDRNIWAFVPAELNPETQSFEQPTDPLRQRLLRNVLKKKSTRVYG